MGISTSDPMTLSDVTDIENSPCVTNREGEGAIRTHFESEQNRDDSPVEMHASGDLPGLRQVFDAMVDKPNTGSIN